MAKTNVRERRLTEAEEEGVQWWDGLTKEQRRDEINRGFELRWNENHCCPHFVIVDCAAGSPHKHVGCQLCIDRGEGPVIDNAAAALECLGYHGDDCPMRFDKVESRG